MTRRATSHQPRAADSHEFRRSTSHSAQRWRIWAARLGLAAIIATSLAYFPYRLLDGSSARKADELNAQYRRTVAAARALSEENVRLRHEIDALERDSSALEDIARNELGMVFPGEIIIRIERQP